MLQRRVVSCENELARDVILAAIAALLSATIITALKVVIENATFEWSIPKGNGSGPRLVTRLWCS
jgi:hypothetical protein